MSLLQFTLLILHIETFFDFLLYTWYIVALLMHLLTIVQLFVDKLLSTFVTTTLLSLVVVVVTPDLM
jgi:uncharacterized MnhB-related membrane protein